METSDLRKSMHLEPAWKQFQVPEPVQKLTKEALTKASQELASTMKTSYLILTDRANLEKDFAEATKPQSTSSSKVERVLGQVGDKAQNWGLWKDYSKGNVVNKRLTYNSDKGKWETKTSYNVGAGLKNTLGNVSSLVGTVANFLPDVKMANNEINDITTSQRKKMQQTLMTTGNPYAMAFAAASMVSDKVGGTASATKGLGLGNDIGNAVASFVPFLRFAGKKMGKQFESDELKGSSMYNWSSTADGLFGGSVVFGGGKARSLVDTNNLQRITATNILKDAKLDFIGAQDPRYYMAAQNELNGGYQQISAKNGAVLQFVKRTVSKSKIQKKQGGGIVRQTPDGNFEITLERTPSYEEWVQQIPEDYRGNGKYDLELLYNRATQLNELGHPELWKLLQNWVFAVTRPTEAERNFYLNLKLLDANGKEYYPFHTGSVVDELDEDGNPTGNYIFLKLGSREENPKLKGELDWFENSEEGKKFLEDYELDSINGRYYYKLKHPEKLKAGGKMNVIPEGALHKNKHHLEDVDEKYKDVTTKGIPVVVESEGGEVVQQAEVERQEIIFRLEITKLLEELSKKHTDEAAIEAGKILVCEILHNTIDNTGEMI